MLSTVNNDSSSLLPNPHAPLNSITSQNDNFTMEVSSHLDKLGKASNKVTETILEDNNQKSLGKLQPASKAISKAEKPKTEKPQIKKKIAALLNNDLSSNKLQSYKLKLEKKNKNPTPTQKDGEGALVVKKELKISDFFKQNTNPIIKNSVEKITKEVLEQQISTEIEVETHAESQEEKAESVEEEKREVVFDFEVQRIWYDCGQKDVLFEFSSPNKDDGEARSIVSRRDLAKKDACMLVAFYERFLDFSKFSGVMDCGSEWKLKPVVRAVTGGGDQK